MTARIKISQAGLAAGVAGKARTDGLATGALVTLEDVSGTGTSTFHLLWTPVEDTTAVASLAATVDPDIWTFSPTAAVYGSYLIELRDQGVPIERRVFGIRTPANQLLIPAYGERADRHANLLNAGAGVIDECNQNADDFPLAALNGRRYAGWWRSLYELYRIVEFGIGSIANNAIALIKLAQQPAKTVLANATSATGNVTALAGGGGFQYLRVNATNNGLEWGILSAQQSTSIVYDVGTATFQAAAKTGVVTASQNSNTFAFGAAAAKSVLTNATNGSAVPSFQAGSAAFQYLRVNSANNALEMATLSSHASSTILYNGSNQFAVDQSASYAWTGWHSIPEWASHGPISAGVSAFWARNTSPTRPMFTDDDGNDWNLYPNTVASMTGLTGQTNSGSNAQALTFTVPANTFVAGTLYKFEGYIAVFRGATTTAANLIIDLLLGGTVFATVTIPILTNPSSGGSVHVTGYVLCLTNGASGTFIANVKAPNDIADQTAVTSASVWALTAGSSNSAASGTTKNTTTTQAIAVQARMSAAVAGLGFNWTAAFLQRAA